MRFYSSGLFHKLTPFRLMFHSYPIFFSNSVLNSLNYSNSKLVLRHGPLRGTAFFLTDTRDLNLGGISPYFYC
jgi:hypothetical protein